MHRRTLLFALATATLVGSATGVLAQAKPSPMQRAGVRAAAGGDTVVVVENYVRADRRQQFEEFVTTFDAASLKYTGPDTVAKAVLRSVRVLYPTKADSDGVYTYMFFADPVVHGGNYDTSYLAHLILPQGEADRLLRLLDESMARPQRLHFVVQHWPR
jgi:hypothetical protein